MRIKPVPPLVPALISTTLNNALSTKSGMDRPEERRLSNRILTWECGTGVLMATGSVVGSADRDGVSVGDAEGIEESQAETTSVRVNKADNSHRLNHRSMMFPLLNNIEYLAES